MVKQKQIEKTFQIPAGQSNYLQFDIDTKDEIVLFDIQVEQVPHRFDDIQIYIMDKENYQNYIQYYKAFRSGLTTQHIKWTTYVRAKAFWTPIFFHSNKIGPYYLVLDNLHSTIMEKIIHVKGTLSSQPTEQLTKATMSASEESLPNIHPKILLVSQNLFLDGHYSQSIFEAVKLIEIEIKKKSEIKKIGEALANEVFNENHPILKLNNLKTPEEFDEQRGFRYLFAGTFVGIKNPRSHGFDNLNDQKLAVEYLTFLSMLMRKLEKSKVRKIKKYGESKVSVLDGVGQVTAEKLKGMGIETVSELAKTDEGDLKKFLDIETEVAFKLIKRAQVYENKSKKQK